MNIEVGPDFLEATANGGYFVIQYSVGGGGGHSLTVENIQIVAQGEAIAGSGADAQDPHATNVCIKLTLRAGAQDDTDKQVERKASKSQALAKWIEGECSGDYKGILMQ